jgi:hypothetical protein
MQRCRWLRSALLKTRLERDFHLKERSRLETGASAFKTAQANLPAPRPQNRSAIIAKHHRNS